MKTKISILLLVIVLASSCKKFKKPSACIDGPSEVEVGETVTFKWCGDEADEINWSDNYGGSGSGKEFTTSFQQRGTVNIQANGKNKYREGESTNLSLSCGKTSFNWCSISDNCNNGGTIYNTSDLLNYKAYLYTSKTDWAADVDQGTHSRCIDSTTCTYRAQQGSAGAYFRKSLPAASIAFVSVEYRNPQTPTNLLSNWGELMKNSSDGVINANNSDYNDNTGYTYLSNVAKKILRGKWKLTSTEINGTTLSPSECNLDDYIRFYANGTWKYHVGADNCNGNSSESVGTYEGNLSACIQNGGLSLNLTTSSGSFSGLNGGYFTNSFTKLKINFYTGSVSGTFEFTYTP